MTALSNDRDMAVLRLIEQDERISLREIIDRSDITSLSIARKALVRLAAAGYIELPPKGRNRSLRLLRPSGGDPETGLMPAMVALRLLDEAAELLVHVHRTVERSDLQSGEPYTEYGAWDDAAESWLSEYRRWRK